MRAKIQGDVELEAVVRPDGTVGDVRVVKSLDAGDAAHAYTTEEFSVTNSSVLV